MIANANKKQIQQKHIRRVSDRGGGGKEHRSPLIHKAHSPENYKTVN